ncbi:MAG: dihydropteroate synthase, partial [Chloroflexi bacterium]|nr:dihydropteroate synthase [Chloroflexota bacterium]
MGILNATDDSFSGDGIGSNVDKALQLTKEFVDAGVDIVDVGGESTRPKSIYEGVHEVSSDEELSKVIPIIDAIRSNFDVTISIDSRKSDVAEEAIKHGANIINDISMLNYDENMIDLLKKTDNPYILTHNRKINPGKVIDQVVNDINITINNLEKEGIDKKRIVIDPGFGFNKSIKQNIELHNDFASEKFNNFPI